MNIDAKIDKKAAILGLDVAGYSIKYKLNELSDEELIKLINNHTESYGVTITLHKPKIAKWITNNFSIGDSKSGIIVGQNYSCSNCNFTVRSLNEITKFCPDCGFKMEEKYEKIIGYS